MFRGRVAFGAMEGVAFGRRVAEVAVEQIDRVRAARAFLLVSGTLNHETFEIKNEIRKSTPWVPHIPRKIDDPTQIREMLLLAAQ